MVKTLLKTTLLLCALMAGSGSAWADSSWVKYGIQSKTTVSTSGTAPTNSSATFSTTYSNQNQLTKDNSQTLTLSGYNGYKVTNITLSMRSNSSGGAGSLSYSTDGGETYTYVVGTSSSGVNFNNSAWYGKWSTTYVDVSEDVSIEPTTSNFIIKIEATANSLYCQSYTLTYEAVTPANTVATPVISGTEKFLESTEVSISCGTDDAVIQYSTDGGTTWTNYSAAFTLNATTTVQAKATADGLEDSETATKTFTKVTAMTVAEALTAIDALEDNGTIADSYVTGKVSRVGTISSGAFTYWISDNGEEENELQVYRGKGIDGASFSATTDLEFGDEVVIFGELKKYVSGSNTTPEFNTGSELISLTAKPASDLTKTDDITLDFKNGATDVDLTGYFTTSSTGAITYTVADETVIDNADELISALKVGTTTVTVSQAATLSYKAGEITINVTVQDTRDAATTIPAINISTLKVGNSGTISVTDPVKADEGVTFSYASSDDDVLLIADDAYEAEAVGTVTVTVTATPNNTNLYTSVTETFEVTVEADVKANTEITLDEENGSTAYGTPLSVDYLVTDGYNGTLAYTIDNSAIADVEIGADAITFTPKAVGTAIITISAPATATFNAADDVTYTLTVTAPTGGTTAVESGFSKVTSTNDLTNGDYLIVYEDGNCAFDGSLETLDATSNTIDVTISNDEIAATTDNTKAVFTLAAVDGGYTVKSASGLYIGQTSDANGLASDASTTYTNTISFDTDGNANIISSSAYLRYNSASNQARFRYYKSSSYTNQKAIQLYKLAGAALTATLNSYGFATYCSQYPLDFSEATDYTAWQITDIDSDNKITFTQITGSVKGGTGIFLKGEAGATVTLTSADSENTLSDNLLEGTLAPTYVASGEYYGLSGDSFVKVNAGTVKAGKAILDADWITEGAGSRFTFVFADEASGISETEIGALNADNAIYNLNGQRVNTPKKGLYIVNGKKIVMK